MEVIKQDMPPPGGFSSINYKRVPLKQPWSSPLKWLIAFGMMGIGWVGYRMDRERIYYEIIEKKAATYSIFPLLAAENDRKRLRHFAKVRDEEAELMKDVEGWEVGKYFGEPIYKTLQPNEWYEPHCMESWILTDLKNFKFARSLRLSH